jgi:glycosyltransferase involved in cell wall biosynthesis
MTVSDVTTPVTVVICTRNRGDKIVGTIASLLDNTYPEFSVLIIDQSDNDGTASALAPFLADERVRYLRSNQVGVSRSRTLALRESRTELVLSTDDDCVVDPEWVATNVQVLLEHPQAGIVFGDVVAADDPGAGYAPSSETDEDFVIRSMRSWRTTDGANVGIGASMAMRRSMLLDAGGFDNQLGPGSRLRNAEDTDMTIRTVLAGHEVVRTRRIRVDHFGHRSPDEFRQLNRASMLGIGAVCGKLIRRRPLATMWVIVGIVWKMVIRVVIHDLIRLRKPPVLNKVVYFTKGFWVGLRMPLERSPNILFRSEP